jgi:hypothetical protein
MPVPNVVLVEAFAFAMDMGAEAPVPFKIVVPVVGVEQVVFVDAALSASHSSKAGVAAGLFELSADGSKVTLAIDIVTPVAGNGAIPSSAPWQMSFNDVTVGAVPVLAAVARLTDSVIETVCATFMARAFSFASAR